MNLVIGSSSQLARYFPIDYQKISSRNVDLDKLRNGKFESVYITFAEQRIYDTNVDYITPNYLYTLQIIESLLESADRIVCYTSCELWNELSGFITVDTKPKFASLDNEYILSKLLLWNKIKERRKINNLYDKIVIVHPFYFNSVHRSDYFLFGKVFNAIVKGIPLEVGNLNFYRDMVHTKFAVAKSMELTKDSVIGSGKLFNIRHFIMDLYKMCGLNFDTMVKEHKGLVIPGKEKLIMAQVNWNYTYDDLVSDTYLDILSSKGIYGYDWVID